MPNYVSQPSVKDTLKFVAKVCAHPNRRKSALTSADIRRIWDKLLEKYGDYEKFPLFELRTFTMCLFQHTTFCRFSDVKNLKISNLLFDADYFKVTIEKSKTDQAGRGDYVFVPKLSTGFIDPHMLLCLYVQKLSGVDNDPDIYLFPPLV